jgi:hypothetical protein
MQTVAFSKVHISLNVLENIVPQEEYVRSVILYFCLKHFAIQ